MAFGDHVDNAVRQIPGTPHRLRTDVSATLFLSPPEEYDGGELIVDDMFGAHSVKLAAGDMVVYPASSLHRVQPVTRGVRDGGVLLGSEHGARRRCAHAALRAGYCHSRSHRARARIATACVRLTGCYHNLLRRWAEL